MDPKPISTAQTDAALAALALVQRDLATAADLSLPLPERRMALQSARLYAHDVDRYLSDA